VKVGPRKTQVGLLRLYNAEMSRLESIEHSDISPLRKYVNWFVIQWVAYARRPEAIRAFIEHDQTFCENCALDGFTHGVYWHTQP
jgi:hypothetical protein